MNQLKTITQPSNLVSLFFKLWGCLGARRQVQYLGLLVIMLLSTFAEVLSLGAVVPFLGILISPDQIFAHPSLQWLIRGLGVTAPSALVLPLTISFVLLALFAGGLRLLLLWFGTRLAFASGADISLQVYRKTLYQPYGVHIRRNSSEVITGIIHRVDGVIFWVILPLLTLISSLVLLIAVMSTLIVIDPVVALTAIMVFGLSYGAISLVTRKRLMSNGFCINEERAKVIKALQEGLGGVRDVLLDGTQPFYCELYRRSDWRLRRAYGDNNFISGCPRPVMESLGMVLIAVLAFILGQQEGGISSSLPMLGALALGAQRLLPTLQQAYGSWASIMGGRAALVDTIELLEQEIVVDGDTTVSPVNFENMIALRCVYFRYSDEGPWVLNGLDLSILKGERIGIVGSTGSGKSTALDILMGLLQANEGQLLIDGKPLEDRDVRGWHDVIAHVPQQIYLVDGTLAENIALGIPSDQIDMARVKRSATMANISQFAESHPDGYAAHVGENGIRLSGGQRQRIGIARALYKEAQILVLDEATSALDGVTENQVMDAIRGLDRDLTVIIVTHRLTTVRDCDRVFELQSGRVLASGTYEELCRSSETFRIIERCGGL